MQGSLFNKFRDFIGISKEEQSGDVSASGNENIADASPAVNETQKQGRNKIEADKSSVEAHEIKPVEQKTDSEASEDKNRTEQKPVSLTPDEIKEEVIKILKTCYDPEIPVDVYELGLIYDIKVATNGDVLIVMTLTSPSCPVAGILPNEIEMRVKEHPVVNDCKVQLTFDPPWNQRMMSEVAMLELGFL